MKKVLLILLTTLPMSLLLAQVCEPDPFYQDSTGVFPLPKSAENPNAGITECAVIGEPYEFNFTVAVGDSITIDLFGQMVQLPIDSVVVNSVDGLPSGINYVCEPGNCSFPKNSLGCALLTGTPLSSVTPGDYPLVITGTAYFPVFPSTFVIEFPGEFFPGEYILRVLANSSEDCGLVSSTKSIEREVAIAISPNPSPGPIQIDINASINGDFTLSMVDLLGKVAHQEKVQLSVGANRLNIDASDLTNGMYILVLENELGKISQKVLIQH